MHTKYCRDCGLKRPVADFSANRTATAWRSTAAITLPSGRRGAGRTVGRNPCGPAVVLVTSWCRTGANGVPIAVRSNKRRTSRGQGGPRPDAALTACPVTTIVGDATSKNAAAVAATTRIVATGSRLTKPTRSSRRRVASARSARPLRRRTSTTTMQPAPSGNCSASAATAGWGSSGTTRLSYARRRTRSSGTAASSRQRGRGAPGPGPVRRVAPALRR